MTCTSALMVAVTSLLVTAALSTAVVFDQLLPLPEPQRWTGLDYTTYLLPGFVPVAGTGCSLSRVRGVDNLGCRNVADSSAATQIYAYTPSIDLCVLVHCATTAQLRDVVHNASIGSPHRHESAAFEYVYVQRRHLDVADEHFFCEHAASHCYGRAESQFFNATSGICECECQLGFRGSRCEQVDGLGNAWPSGSFVLHFESAENMIQLATAPATLPSVAIELDLVLKTSDTVRDVALPGTILGLASAELSSIAVSSPSVVSAVSLIAPGSQSAVGTGVPLRSVALDVQLTLDFPPRFSEALARGFFVDLRFNQTNETASFAAFRSRMLGALAADTGATLLSGASSASAGAFTRSSPTQREGFARALANMTDASQRTREVESRPQSFLTAIPADQLLLLICSLGLLVATVVVCADIPRVMFCSRGSQHYDGRDDRVARTWIRGDQGVAFISLLLVFGAAVAALVFYTLQAQPLDFGRTPPVSHMVIPIDFGSAEACRWSHQYQQAPIRIGSIIASGDCNRVHFYTGAARPYASNRLATAALFMSGMVSTAVGLVASNGSSMQHCKETTHRTATIPWDELEGDTLQCRALGSSGDARWRVLTVPHEAFTDARRVLAADHLIPHHTSEHTENAEAASDPTGELLVVDDNIKGGESTAATPFTTADFFHFGPRMLVNATTLPRSVRANIFYTTPALSRLITSNETGDRAPTMVASNVTDAGDCPVFGAVAGYGANDKPVSYITHSLPANCAPRVATHAAAAGATAAISVGNVAGTMFDPSAPRKGFTDGSFTVSMWVRLRDPSKGRAGPIDFRGFLFVTADAVITTEADIGNLPPHLVAALEQLANQVPTSRVAQESPSQYFVETADELERTHASFVNEGLPRGASAIAFGLYLDTHSREIAVVYRERTKSSVESIRLSRLDDDATNSINRLMKMAEHPDQWHFLALAMRATDGRKVFSVSVDADHGLGVSAPRKSTVCLSAGLSLPRVLPLDADSVSVSVPTPEFAALIADSKTVNRTQEKLFMQRGGRFWVGVALPTAVGDAPAQLDTYNVRIHRGALTRQRLLMISGLLRPDHASIGRGDATVDLGHESTDHARKDVEASVWIAIVSLSSAFATVILGTAWTIFCHLRDQKNATFQPQSVTRGRALTDRRLAAFLFTVPFGIHHFMLFLRAWDWPESFRYVSSYTLFLFSLQFSLGFPAVIPVWVDFIVHGALSLTCMYLIRVLASNDTDHHIGNDLEPLAFLRTTRFDMPLSLLPSAFHKSEADVSRKDDVAAANDIRNRWESGAMVLPTIVPRVPQFPTPQVTAVGKHACSPEMQATTEPRSAGADEELAAEPRVHIDTDLMLVPHAAGADSGAADDTHADDVPAKDVPAHFAALASRQKYAVIRGRSAQTALSVVVKRLVELQEERLQAVRSAPRTALMANRMADAVDGGWYDDRDTFVSEVFAVSELRDFAHVRRRQLYLKAQSRADKILEARGLPPPSREPFGADHAARPNGDDAAIMVDAPDMESLLAPVTADAVVAVWIPIDKGERQAVEEFVQRQQLHKEAVRQRDRKLKKYYDARRQWTEMERQRRAFDKFEETRLKEVGRREQEMADAEAAAEAAESSDERSEDVASIDFELAQQHASGEFQAESDPVPSKRNRSKSVAQLVREQKEAEAKLFEFDGADDTDDDDHDEAGAAPMPDTIGGSIPHPEPERPEVDDVAPLSSIHFGLTPILSAALASGMEEYTASYFKDRFQSIQDAIAHSDCDLIVDDIDALALEHLEATKNAVQFQPCTGLLVAALARLDLVFGELEQAAYEYITGECLASVTVQQHERVAATFRNVVDFLRDNATILGVLTTAMDDLEKTIRERAAADTRSLLADRLKPLVQKQQLSESSGTADTAAEQGGRRRRRDADAPLKDDPNHVAGALLRLHEACHGVLYADPAAEEPSQPEPSALPAGFSLRMPMPTSTAAKDGSSAPTSPLNPVRARRATIAPMLSVADLGRGQACGGLTPGPTNVRNREQLLGSMSGDPLQVPDDANSMASPQHHARMKRGAEELRVSEHPEFSKLLRAVERRRDAFVLADVERHLAQRPEWPLRRRSMVLPIVRRLAEKIFPVLRSHHSATSTDLSALDLSPANDLHVKLLQLVLLHPSTTSTVMPHAHLVAVLIDLEESLAEVAEASSSPRSKTPRGDAAASTGELSMSASMAAPTPRSSSAAGKRIQHREKHYQQVLSGDVEELLGSQPSFGGLLHVSDARTIATNVLHFALATIALRGRRVSKLIHRASRLMPTDSTPTATDPFVFNKLRLVHARVTVDRDTEHGTWRTKLHILDTSPTAASEDLEQDFEERVDRAVSEQLDVHREALSSIRVAQQRVLRSVRDMVIRQSGAGITPEALAAFSQTFNEILKPRAVDVLPALKGAVSARTTTAAPSNFGAPSERTAVSAILKGLNRGNTATGPRKRAPTLAEAVRADDLRSTSTGLDELESRCWWTAPRRGNDMLRCHWHSSSDVLCTMKLQPKLHVDVCPDHTVSLTPASQTAADKGTTCDLLADRHAAALRRNFWYRLFVQHETSMDSSAAATAGPDATSDKILQCPHPCCVYAVPRKLADDVNGRVGIRVVLVDRTHDLILRMMSPGWTRFGRTGQTIAAQTAVFVLLLITVPVLWNTASVVSCHPSTSCIFPEGCYLSPSEIQPFFVMTALLCVLVLVCIIFGFGIDVSKNIYRRKGLLLTTGVVLARDFHRAGFSFPFAPDPEHVGPATSVMPSSFFQVMFFTMPDAAWKRVTCIDNSYLRMLYIPLRARWAAVGFPIALLFHTAIVIGVVAIEPDSTTQLAVAAGIEGAGMLITALVQPFCDVETNIGTLLTQCAQLALIGMAALSRVSRLSWDPEVFDRDSYGDAHPISWMVGGSEISPQRFDMHSIQIVMGTISATWVAFVFIYLIFLVLIPFMFATTPAEQARIDAARWEEHRPGAALIAIADEQTELPPDDYGDYGPAPARANTTAPTEPTGSHDFRMSPDGDRQRMVDDAMRHSYVAGRFVLNKLKQNWRDRRLNRFESIVRARKCIVHAMEHVREAAAARLSRSETSMRSTGNVALAPTNKRPETVLTKSEIHQPAWSEGSSVAGSNDPFALTPAEREYSVGPGDDDQLAVDDGDMDVQRTNPQAVAHAGKTLNQNVKVWLRGIAAANPKRRKRKG